MPALKSQRRWLDRGSTTRWECFERSWRAAGGCHRSTLRWKAHCQAEREPPRRRLSSWRLPKRPTGCWAGGRRNPWRSQSSAGERKMISSVYPAGSWINSPRSSENTITSSSLTARPLPTNACPCAAPGSPSSSPIPRCNTGWSMDNTPGCAPTARAHQSSWPGPWGGRYQAFGR